MQIWLSFLCRSMPMCSTAGLHHLAAIDRVNGCGASATTFGGGQPLHPIYRLLSTPWHRTRAQFTFQQDRCHVPEIRTQLLTGERPSDAASCRSDQIVLSIL